MPSGGTAAISDLYFQCSSQGHSYVVKCEISLHRILIYFYYDVYLNVLSYQTLHISRDLFYDSFYYWNYYV
jgi:hypothetical protein